ncbi:MAG: aminoacyl-tRNA hydrolase [Spirochaetota bacterium]
MAVIVGLGNPGSAYSLTRHNAGFMAVDEVARELHLTWHKPLFHSCRLSRMSLCGERHLLVQPLTYMNRSGEIIPFALKKAGADVLNLVVACDTIDLPAGVVRVRRGGSPAGHNGIKSVLEYTGDPHFLRVYIGVGRPSQGTSVVDHVLGSPSEEEHERFLHGVRRAASALIQLLEGTEEQRVMNEFNRKGDNRSSSRNS